MKSGVTENGIAYDSYLEDELPGIPWLRKFYLKHFSDTMPGIRVPAGSPVPRWRKGMGA